MRKFIFRGMIYITAATLVCSCSNDDYYPSLEKGEIEMTQPEEQNTRALSYTVSSLFSSYSGLGSSNVTTVNSLLKELQALPFDEVFSPTLKKFHLKR